MRDMEHQRQIIDTFVNSVYVFDDRVVLNFNGGFDMFYQ